MEELKWTKVNLPFARPYKSDAPCFTDIYSLQRGMILAVKEESIFFQGTEQERRETREGFYIIGDVNSESGTCNCCGLGPGTFVKSFTMLDLNEFPVP